MEKALNLDFDPSVPVERATTPPAWWYLEASFLSRERVQVFGETWQAVGRTAQAAAPGQFFTADVAGEPVVVLRDEEGQLRAFSNVCRHRAACVATGAGTASELACRYHGWAYHLNGTLKRAPRLGPVQDFSRAQFALPALQVEALGPLIFVHLGRPAQPLRAQLAALLPRLSMLSPLSTLPPVRFITQRTYEIACNWKVFVDNYLDGGYHVPTVHGDLASSLDLQRYRTELFDTFSVQSCPGTADERVGTEAVYAFIYPNFMLNRYGPWLDVNLVLPLGPERCLTVFDYYLDFHVAPDEQFIQRSLAASEQVQLEDITICESVQRGLRSRSYEKGRYAPRIEHADHQFHCLLARSLMSRDPDARSRADAAVSTF